MVWRRAVEEEYYLYIRNWFKKWAPVYDLVDIFISGIREKVVRVADASHDSKVLDVATGTGKQAFAFAKRGYAVYGVDLSEDMLRVANRKNRYPNAKFQVADATNLPFEDEHFDVSCISFALHDMPSAVRKKALEEMARATKRGGMIVVVDYALPASKICRYLIYHVGKSYESKYYPEFVKSDVRALLRKLGIQIEKEESVLLGAGRIFKGIRMDSDVC
jgi:demethylmenaquinone methyltransferase/2-methoxy-6-polyprenyl-1,4-benzoquinol methylase